MSCFCQDQNPCVHVRSHAVRGGGRGLAFCRTDMHECMYMRCRNMNACVVVIACTHACVAAMACRQFILKDISHMHACMRCSLCMRACMRCSLCMHSCMRCSQSIAYSHACIAVACISYFGSTGTRRLPDTNAHLTRIHGVMLT